MERQNIVSALTWLSCTKGWTVSYIEKAFSQIVVRISMNSLHTMTNYSCSKY